MNWTKVIEDLRAQASMHEERAVLAHAGHTGRMASKFYATVFYGIARALEAGVAKPVAPTDDVIAAKARKAWEELTAQNEDNGFDYGEADGGLSILDGAYDLEAMVRVILRDD